jgi:DNA-binding transcriptional MerR regulator
MQKLYYSISEVSKIVDEEQYILRYWEKEFTQLKPRKNRGGNRIYSERDIALLKLIKHLLRNEKLSLRGAQEQISKVFESQAEDLYKEYMGNVQASARNEDEELFTVNISSDDVVLNKKDILEIYELLKEAVEELK